MAALAPLPVDEGTSAGYAPPRTPVEELLADTWREVLGIARVGIHDGFFELGGHSLLAAQVAAQDLGLPATGGSDAHTLATVGQGYTLFPGGSADDLYRAIKAGEVRWGGSYWSLSQYIDMGRQLVRQHGLRGSLGLAAAGAGLADRQHM